MEKEKRFIKAKKGIRDVLIVDAFIIGFDLLGLGLMTPEAVFGKMFLWSAIAAVGVTLTLTASYGGGLFAVFAAFLSLIYLIYFIVKKDLRYSLLSAAGLLLNGIFAARQVHTDRSR